MLQDKDAGRPDLKMPMMAWGLVIHPLAAVKWPVRKVEAYLHSPPVFGNTPNLSTITTITMPAILPGSFVLVTGGSGFIAVCVHLCVQGRPS